VSWALYIISVVSFLVSRLFFFFFFETRRLLVPLFSGFARRSVLQCFCVLLSK